VGGGPRRGGALACNRFTLSNKDHGKRESGRHILRLPYHTMQFSQPSIYLNRADSHEMQRDFLLHLNRNKQGTLKKLRLCENSKIVAITSRNRSFLLIRQYKNHQPTTAQFRFSAWCLAPLSLLPEGPPMPRFATIGCHLASAHISPAVTAAGKYA